MTIGVLSVRLRLPSRTLKEKRTIVKSVVERLRVRYNASVAEVDDLDAAGYATIAAVCVSNDGAHADAQLQEMARAVEEWRLDAELVDVRTEVMVVGEE